MTQVACHAESSCTFYNNIVDTQSATLLHHLLYCTTVKDAPTHVCNQAEEGVRYAMYVLRHMHC